MSELQRTSADTPPLTAQTIRAIAVAAHVDPGTVRRVLGGRPTRGATRERIEIAIRQENLGHLLEGTVPDGPR